MSDALDHIVDERSGESPKILLLIIIDREDYLVIFDFSFYTSNKRVRQCSLRALHSDLSVLYLDFYARRDDDIFLSNL